MAEFKKAERKQAKLRLALTGPSGSGKTWSALLIASGIGKKIAVIDTENHSASLYAGEKGIPAFDTLEIDVPYTVTKYIDAIKSAMENKYDVLIIDSITHAWAAEGGLLDKKQALDVRGGNSYTNWASITKEQEAFKAALLGSDIHLIVSMRSKQDYIMEENSKGKLAPRKVGMAPIQRDGMEYEFTMVLDLAMDHNASISKTRVHAFDGRVFKPSKETGKELLAWLMEGKEPVALPPAAVEEPAPVVEPTPEIPASNNKNGSNVIIPTKVTPMPATETKPPYWIITDLHVGDVYTQDSTVAKTALYCVNEKRSMNCTYKRLTREGKFIAMLLTAEIVEAK